MICRGDHVQGMRAWCLQVYSCRSIASGVWRHQSLWWPGHFCLMTVMTDADTFWPRTCSPSKGHLHLFAEFPPHRMSGTLPVFDWPQNLDEYRRRYALCQRAAEKLPGRSEGRAISVCAACVCGCFRLFSFSILGSPFLFWVYLYSLYIICLFKVCCWNIAGTVWRLNIQFHDCTKMCLFPHVESLWTFITCDTESRNARYKK